MNGHLWVNGVVAARDMQPYIQLSNDSGIVAQMSMAQARNFAMDILQMSARTEADVMIHKFFAKAEFPKEAAGAMMIGFRDFRAELDDEKIETERANPDEGRI